jgi:hypothetical protein
MPEAGKIGLYFGLFGVLNRRIDIEQSAGEPVKVAAREILSHFREADCR